VCRGVPSCPWDTCGGGPGRGLVGILWGSREVFGGSRSWSFRVLGLQLSRADSRLRTPNMKRPCQAFAGRRVVDHLMSVSIGCFCARFTCPPGLPGSGGMGTCGRRWPGRVGRGRLGLARFFLPGGRRGSGVQVGPQGRRRRQCRVVKPGRRGSTGTGLVWVTAGLVSRD
jgi:hypothetical protein